MLIQALCDYYDVLAAEGNKIPLLSYSEQNIHYCIFLTKGGEIDDIIIFGELDKKGKIIPKSVYMPYQKKFTGTRAKIIDCRSKYIFGLLPKSGTLILSNNGEHKAFVEKNLKFIEELHSPVVDAYRNFLTNWKPEAEFENPFLLSLKANLSNSNFVFCLSGRPDLLLHEDMQIKMKWEKLFQENSLQTEGQTIAQCAITGKAVPITQLHDNIKLKGTKNDSVPLISCNFDSGESYGNKQAHNSNVSEIAMRKYTVALNALLKDAHHHQTLNKTTVVYWANGGVKDQNTTDLISALTFGDTLSAEETDAILEKVLQHVEEGCILPSQLNILGKIDTTITFYIIGLEPAPGKGRITLKFLYRQSFGKILHNIAQYQQDLQIGDTIHAIPIYRIQEEVRPVEDKKQYITAKDKIAAVNSAFFNSLAKVIFGSGCFPNFILSETIGRIKRTRTISPLQAGILKAYTNQKSRFINQKEELTVALDTTNTTPAYLCGRLFAVLERLQKSASDASRTIVETSFNTAAAKPASVFPTLLKLAKIYQKKLREHGNPALAGFYNKCILEIMDKLHDNFPITLSLPEQGKFMVGYYQQLNYRTNKLQNTEENKNAQ